MKSADHERLRLLAEPILRGAHDGDSSTYYSAMVVLSRGVLALLADIERWEAIAERDHGAPIDTVEALRRERDELRGAALAYFNAEDHGTGYASWEAERRLRVLVGMLATKEQP